MISSVEVFELHCDQCRTELYPGGYMEDVFRTTEAAEEYADDQLWSVGADGTHVCPVCTCKQEGHVTVLSGIYLFCERCLTFVGQAPSGCTPSPA